MITRHRSYLDVGIVVGRRAPPRTVPSILLQLVANNAGQEVYRHQQRASQSRTLRNQHRILARNAGVLDRTPLPNPHSQHRNPAS